MKRPEEVKRKGLGLFDLEAEVLAEGREWMRVRMEEKLQERANEVGEISPLKRETIEPT